jgi:mRNA interferase RelE/StbE
VYEVWLTTKAEKSYLKLDADTRQRMDRIFEHFEEGEFTHPNIHALRGRFSGSLRYRLGSWRIIFHILYKERIVWIESITHRGKAYR